MFELFKRKPPDTQNTEKLEDTSLVIADMQRQYKRLEMKLINANKRIDRLEASLDNVYEVLEEEGLPEEEEVQ